MQANFSIDSILSAKLQEEKSNTLLITENEVNNSKHKYKEETLLKDIYQHHNMDLSNYDYPNEFLHKSKEYYGKNIYKSERAKSVCTCVNCMNIDVIETMNNKEYKILTEDFLSANNSSNTLPKRRRTIFSPDQLERLEFEFQQQQYLVGQERRYLAKELKLNEIQIKVWFQNRRIKWRKYSSGYFNLK